MKTAPSIFNDVLGPVMRGPSSSHSAAALRIGRMGRDLMGGDLPEVIVEYDPSGALVTTHESQGSDLGLFGGLMGWETDDARLPDFRQEIVRAGISVDIRYVAYGAKHPNTYRLTMRNAREEHVLLAISTGGGMIVVKEIDGVPVEMEGDYFETVVFVDGTAEALVKWLERDAEYEDLRVREGNGRTMIEVKSRRRPSEDLLAEIAGHPGVTLVRVLDPVLPVLGRKNLTVPFLGCEEMISYREREGGTLELWELALRYEAERGGISEDEVLAKMGHLVEVFENSISTGLGGTEYADRILPYQSGKFGEMLKGGQLIPGDVMNRVILYVTAMMEMKSSMGVIVAAPTAGSCGALPGAVIGVCDAMGKGKIRAHPGDADGRSDRSFHHRPLDLCGGGGGLHGRVRIRREHGRGGARGRRRRDLRAAAQRGVAGLAEFVWHDL